MKDNNSRTAQNNSSASMVVSDNGMDTNPHGKGGAQSVTHNARSPWLDFLGSRKGRMLVWVLSTITTLVVSKAMNLLLDRLWGDDTMVDGEGGSGADGHRGL